MPRRRGVITDAELLAWDGWRLELEHGARSGEPELVRRTIESHPAEEMLEYVEARGLLPMCRLSALSSAHCAAILWSSWGQ